MILGLCPWLHWKVLVIRGRIKWDCIAGGTPGLLSHSCPHGSRREQNDCAAPMLNTPPVSAARLTETKYTCGAICFHRIFPQSASSCPWFAPERGMSVFCSAAFARTKGSRQLTKAYLVTSPRTSFPLAATNVCPLRRRPRQRAPLRCRAPQRADSASLLCAAAIPVGASHAPLIPASTSAMHMATQFPRTDHPLRSIVIETLHAQVAMWHYSHRVIMDPLSEASCVCIHTRQGSCLHIPSVFTILRRLRVSLGSPEVFLGWIERLRSSRGVEVPPWFFVGRVR